jgi:hypothetical protein
LAVDAPGEEINNERLVQMTRTRLCAVALLALAGCRSAATSTPPPSDGSVADGAPADADAGADLAVSPDGAADAALDVALDAADGPAAEVAPDGPSDAGIADAAPDTTGDSAADAADAATDSSPDAPLDATADSARADAAPDGPISPWPRIIPGAIVSIAFAPSGALVTAGSIAPSVDLGCPASPAGTTSMIVAAFAPADASCLWSSRFGAAAGTFGSMAVTPAGDVALGGVFGSSPFDLGGGPLPQVLPNWQTPFVALFSVGPTGLAHKWSTTFTMETVGQGIVGLTATPTLTVAGTSAQEFLVGGASVTRCCTTTDSMFVVPLTAVGGVKWARGARPTSGTDIEPVFGYDVAASPNFVFVTGEIDTSADFDSVTIAPAKSTDAFLAAYDAATGTIGWARHWGGVTQGLPSRGLRLLAESGNTVLVTGHAADGTDFGFGPINSGSQENGFVARVDTQGKVLAVASVPVDYGSISEIARRPDGSFVVVGSFRRPFTIGGTMLTSDLQGDLFMADLSADLGTWSNAEVIGSPGEASVAPLAVAADGSVAISIPFLDSVDFRGVHYAAAGGNHLLTILPP